MSAPVPSPAALRRIALDAAGAVSADLAAAFRSPSAAGPGPEAKSTHHDLVTVHDRRTEARLVAALTTAVPAPPSSARSSAPATARARPLG